MQSVYGEPALSRLTTGRAARIVERALAANGVTRARDLPEEARVRLYRRLSAFLAEERAAQWERQISGSPLQRAGHWFLECMEAIRQTLQS